MITNKFNYPELKRLNNDLGRFYIDSQNNHVPSVTTVLNNISDKKTSIDQWRKRVGDVEADRVMKEATDIGSMVHLSLENYLNNEELKNQEVLPLFMFTQLKPELDNINNIVMQEGGLYSDRWGIAGRVDCIAEYDGKITVIDFKTSTKEKKEEWIENYFIQCTAYCEMFEERYGRAIDQIAVLIVCEDGALQTFVKDKKDYLPLLQPAIDEFWAEQDAVQPNSH